MNGHIRRQALLASVAVIALSVYTVGLSLAPPLAAAPPAPKGNLTWPGALPPWFTGEPASMTADLSNVTLQGARTSSEHHYYVPFNDANLWTLFDDKNTGLPGARQCHTTGVPVAGTLNSSVFLIASADRTRFYYDHWEDEYDADPLVPGPTTEAGMLDAGAIHVFQDNIDPAQVADRDVFFYDGRDRITVVGEEASVVRQAYPSTPDPRLAAAWEIPEVADWGMSYIATVGEDLAFNPGGVEDHDFTGLEIMAALPGTEVFYNGVSQGVLDAGGTVFVDGANDGAGGDGIDSTDTITATGPIQIQMMTGACGARYSAHGYTLRPTSGWGVEYWVPVPGFSCKGDNADSDIYLHNPNSSAIEVTAVSDLGTAVITIPANTTISVLDYVANNLGWIDISTGFEGLQLFSDDEFWGMGVIDSSSNGRSDSEIHDWGYSLIPLCACSSQAIVGYAPGNTAGPPPTDNGNLAFVTAVTDSVIYVDLNQDGLPDPFDMTGNGDRDEYDAWGVPEWDEPTSALGIPLEAGRVLRVGDPYDRNLMGALIYTLSMEENIAVAWGQDPCQAGVASPYLDLGYTVLPVSIPHLSKADELAIDADLTGSVSPGDTITYTLVVHNNGRGMMNNVVLTDPLPYTYTNFVVGSLWVTTPPPIGATEYSNDGVNFAEAFENPDIRALRVTWPSIGPGQTVTATFRVQIRTDIPVDVYEISNQAIMDSSDTDPAPSVDPDDPDDPDTDTPTGRPLLSIDKRVSPPTVQPGGRITYTLVVSNYGNGVALLTAITDVLPSWMEYVPHTLDLTWPIARVEITTRTLTSTSSFHGNYADDFDLTATQTTNYAGSDGSLHWSTDWTEVNDDGNPATGETQVLMDGNALSEPAHVWMEDTDGDDAGIVRTFDLTQFRAPRLRYHVFGDTNGDPDDLYRVQVTGVPDLAESYDGEYTVREIDLTDAAGDPAVSVSILATGGLDPGEFYRFDHIAIYESAPFRVVTRTLVEEHTVLSYTTRTGTDPALYDPLTGHMVITEGMRLPVNGHGFITSTFQVQVQSPLTDILMLGNTACTTSSNWLNILSDPCDDAAVQTQASHALTLTKTAFSSLVSLGDLLTYTINYTITGNEAVEGAVVSDTTPAHTTFYSATPAPVVDPGAGNRGPVFWQVSGLWPPASGITQTTGSLAMVVRVDSELISGTQIRNAAIITDTTGVTDTAETTTTVVLAADLAIIKTDEPDPVIPGETLTYTLQVVNNGPAQAANTVVSDTLPPEVTFVSADPLPLSGPNPLVWDLGLLDPSDTRLLTVVVTVLEDVDQTFTNTARVSSDTTDLDPDNNRDDEPTSPPLPGLELVKTVDPYHAARDMPFTYRLRVTNTGDFAFTALRLEDRLDPRGDFSYLVGSGNPADPDIINVPDLVWFDLVPDIGGPLLPGQSITVSYQVTTTAANDTYTNTASVEGIYPGGTFTDTDEAVVAIADPAVAIDKRLIGVDQDLVAPNYITFTIAITNVGPSTIDVLPLYDEYDTFYLSFEGATPYPDADADDGLVTWFDLTAPVPHGFGRNLPSGDAFIVTVVFRVVRDINSTINRAVVTGATDIHDNAADEVEDDVIIGGIPTAIEVLYFRAVAEETAVRLEWATAAEWDCGGFRLYRNPDPDFDQAQLLAFFEARGPGSTYSYIDREVTYNRVYWYWLAEVSASEPEREDVHGPVWGGVGPNALPVRLYLPLIRKE